MPPVISFLFAAALGFGFGYKLKDCLCKKGKSSVQPDIHIQENSDNTANVIPTPQKNSEFSLHRIEKTFRQFNVPLVSDYSFSRLLNAIERDSYTSLLKHIDNEISTPNELFRFLEDGKLDITNFEIANSDGEPYITQESVNAILEDKEVDYSNLKTVEDKVNFLLILAQGAGTKRLQDSFGNDLATFIHKYETGEDTTIVFNEIKTTIHDRLESKVSHPL